MDNYTCFADYVMKTPAEFATLGEDQQSQQWAILADSGYLGPETNTLGVRVLALRKPTQLTPTEREAQASLARTRVPVKAAFGRIKKMWGIFCTPCRWEQAHFDCTFDFSLLLMNELLQR